MVKVWNRNVLPCACCCLVLVVSLVLLGLLLLCVIKITPQASPGIIKRQVVQGCTAFFLSKINPCQRSVCSSPLLCLALLPCLCAVAQMWRVNVTHWGVLSQSWQLAPFYYYYPFLRHYLIFLISLHLLSSLNFLSSFCHFGLPFAFTLSVLLSVLLNQSGAFLFMFFGFSLLLPTFSKL